MKSHGRFPDAGETHKVTYESRTHDGRHKHSSAKAADMATLARLTQTPVPQKKSLRSVPQTLPIVRTLQGEMTEANRNAKALVSDDIVDFDMSV